MPLVGVGEPAQQTGRCVSISPPKLDVDFVYSYTASSGEVSESTQRWLQFTPTASRMQTTRSGRAGPLVATEETQHMVENDLLVMLVDSVSGNDEAGAFAASIAYSPGLIVMPAFRACADQKMSIPSVTQTNKAARTPAPAQTDAGELHIIAVDVPVTVPAGTFNTVQFTRTLHKPRGTDVTEVWRSTLHGVTVKRVHTTPRTTTTEVLQAIR